MMIDRNDDPIVANLSPPLRRVNSALPEANERWVCCPRGAAPVLGTRGWNGTLAGIY
jgi:hypothetical protein